MRSRVVSGAPALANIFSFAWANLAHGRARVGVLVSLQAAFAIAVGLVALAPIAAGGLVMTIIAVLVARILWAGVLTVRAAVWSANYPRHVMARITGRIVMVSSLGVASGALLVGRILDLHARAARWLYLFAALCGVLAAFRYRAVRVRREYQLLAAEIGSSPVAGDLQPVDAARDPEGRSLVSPLHVLDEPVRIGQSDDERAAGGAVQRSPAAPQPQRRSCC